MLLPHYYIYQIADDCGTLRYIGKGSGRRRARHSCIVKNLLKGSADPSAESVHQKMAMAVTEGREFRIDILADQLSEADAYTMEEELIAKIGRVIVGTGPLWNISAGGAWGYTSLPFDVRSEMIRKAKAIQGAEGRSAAARKREANMGVEGRSARTRKGQQTLGLEGLSARARKRGQNMSPEQRSAIIRKANETLGPERRSAIARKRWANRSPEKRQAIIRVWTQAGNAAQATRRERAATKLLESSRVASFRSVRLSQSPHPVPSSK